MGTNFYVRGYRDSDEPEYHIGKRSAAGLYCWDCGETLCAGGEADIHSGRSAWLGACPKCGKTHDKADGDGTFSKGAAARELGFDKSKPRPKTGVATCSSFTWATPHWERWADFAAEKAAGQCPHCGRRFPKRKRPAIIDDEYGHLYTRQDFEAVLSECPVRYTRSVGQRFS